MSALLSWQPFAACLTADPALFFGADDETQAARQERTVRAQAVCAGCPVQVPCREFAQALGCRWGVWAGEDLEDTRAAPPEGVTRLCPAELHWMTPENSKPVAGTSRVRCRECLHVADRRTAAARRARARDRAAERREQVA